MLEPHHIECIKKTMQMQENIFQHQVRELHRLYSVQRMLMNEPKNEIKQTKFWGSKAGFDIKNSGVLNFEARNGRDIDPSSGGHSGNCSGEMLKMPKGFDLESPAAHQEDMSTGVSAIDEDQTGPSTQMPRNIDDKCTDVELTLSVGGGISKKRSKGHKQNYSLKLDNLRVVDSPDYVRKVKEEFSDSDNTPRASSSSTFSKKSKQSHWIFQDLSLSRT